jgi:hypothetical protein
MSLPASPQPPTAPRILHDRTTSIRRDIPAPGQKSDPIQTREGGDESPGEKSAGMGAHDYSVEGASRRRLG